MMKIKNIFYRTYNFSARKHLVIIFSIALIVRVCVSVIAYQTNVMSKFGDDKCYYEYNTNLVDQGLNFESLFNISDYCGPGIVIVNYPIFYLFGSNWMIIFLYVSVVSSFIPVLIYLISNKFLNKKTAILASFWSIVYILNLKFVPTMGKDIWMTLFLLLNVYYLLIILNNNFKDRTLKNKVKIYLISTLIFALSILYDERFLGFMAIFPLLILFLNKHKINGLKIASIYFLLTVIFLLPWNIGNYKKYGKVVILSKRTEHFTDKVFNYESQDHEVMDDICGLYGIYYLHDNQIDSVINGYITVTDGGYSIPKEMGQAMRNGNLPHPFKWNEALWSRFKEFWRPLDFSNEYQKTGYYFNGKWSLRHNISTFLSYGILLPFFVLGLFRLMKESRPMFFVFFTIISFYCLIHVATICFTVWRYRVPIDSLIMIIAFYYFSYLITRFYFSKA